MRYAIYSRKSKFTGKGESIENQIEMCRDYIKFHFPEDSDVQIEVFEDEGFSGGNTKRPEFQRMMSGIAKRRFDVLVCYRLDRISRNVADFAETSKILKENNVAFASIKENFDTSTPMGTAMMNIIAVFAQLERDTIKDRITDNMSMLARTGRWLGGITPLGFASEQEKKDTVDGKTRTSCKLAPVADEQKLVRQIYAKYLETEALTQVETWTINNGLRSRGGKYFTSTALRDILANPVYCVADEAAYKFFEEQGSSIYMEGSPFDGKHGVAAYNRTKGTGKDKRQPISEWIVAAGKHKGIISSEDWLKVQGLLERNTHQSWAYRPRQHQALLGSVFKCGLCGSRMQPRSHPYNTPDGTTAYYYTCELKVRSNSKQCQCPNINGNELDKSVCDELLRYRDEDSSIAKKLKSLKSEQENRNTGAEREIKDIEKRIAKNDEQIKKRISMLVEADNDSHLYAYTKEEVQKLGNENDLLRKEKTRLEQALEDSADYEHQVTIITGALDTFAATFASASISDKREFLKSIIERIEWDGKDNHIFLHGESRTSRPGRFTGK